MAIVKWTTTHRSEERAAGLAARCRMVMKGYGGRLAFAKRFNLRFSTVRTWKKIPYTIVPLIHNDKPRLFTALFCRPDLQWSQAGEMTSSFRAGQKRKIYS